MNKTVNIYTLSEPDNSCIRYVGITHGSIRQRLRTHLWQIEPTPKTVWIQKLIARNLQPIITLIDVCEDRQTAYRKEQEWIAHFIAQGCNMLNQEAFEKHPRTYLIEDEMRFLEQVKQLRKINGVMFGQYGGLLNE